MKVKYIGKYDVSLTNGTEYEGIAMRKGITES